MAKTINTRVQLKHDIETNWNKATNFIPLAGEVIIYDKDSNYNYNRIKIGDGITNVNVLPFVIEAALSNNQADWDQTDDTQPDYIKNKPDENDAVELVLEMKLVEPVFADDNTIYTDTNNAIYIF